MADMTTTVQVKSVHLQNKDQHQVGNDSKPTMATNIL